MKGTKYQHVFIWLKSGNVLDFVCERLTTVVSKTGVIKVIKVEGVLEHFSPDYHSGGVPGFINTESIEAITLNPFEENEE